MADLFLHNPRCSKSRAALDLVRRAGIELPVREYLHDPLSADELRRIVKIEEVGRRTWKRTKDGYSRRATGTPRAIIAVYTQLVKRDTNWEETLVFDPDQPEDGVTLPSSTPTAEIAHFCELYDNTDSEGRRLLRQQAETLCNVNEDAH